jgi:hypothetical protein
MGMPLAVPTYTTDEEFVVRDRLIWQPADCPAAFELEVAGLFRA